MPHDPARDTPAAGPEDCRRRAAELRAKAAKTRSPQVREQLILMAQDWETLAERPERR